VRFHENLEVDMRARDWRGRDVVNFQLFDLLSSADQLSGRNFGRQTDLITRNGKDVCWKALHDFSLKLSHDPGHSNDRPKPTSILDDKLHHLSECKD
jgi:hypothetical protein